MSKAFSSDGSVDVLSSIRKLVADEARQRAPAVSTSATPNPTPVFTSTVRRPDPASVPFRHTKSARDWLVGAIDEEKRAVRSSSTDDPLTLRSPLAKGNAAKPISGWKPRISLVPTNSAGAGEAGPRSAPENAKAESRPSPEGQATEKPSRRFQPWKQEAIKEGFQQLDGRRDGASAMPRLLLTQDCRVPSPGEPANFNTVAPHRKPRFTIKPEYSEDSDPGETTLGSPAPARSEARASVPEANASGPAKVLDEVVLRDVVADVVHEELRGALGERVTRNVRKLVRAEISRAVEASKLARRDAGEDR